MNYLEKKKSFDVLIIGEKADGQALVKFIRSFEPNAAQAEAGQTKSKFITVRFSEKAGGEDLFATVDKPTTETISVWEREPMFSVLADIIMAPTKDAAGVALPVQYTISATEPTIMKLKAVQSGALLSGSCEPSYMYDNKKQNFVEANKKEIDKVTGKMKYTKGRSIRTSFTKFFTAGELADEGYVDAAMLTTKLNIEKLKVLANTVAKDIEDTDLPPVTETADLPPATPPTTPVGG